MKRIKAKLTGMIPGRSSLGARVLQAGGWSIIQIVTTNLLRLASNLTLTRYLAPEAFGLMAMIGTLITAFTLFTDIGLSQSITRDKDGENDHFLRVAWTIKLIRGILIAGCVLLAALGTWAFAPIFAPLGSVYADPRLPLLVAISALAPLMIGAKSTAEELTIRQLQNWRFTVVGIAAQVLSLTVMVTFVQFSPTVWALLTGMLVATAFDLMASHLFYPGPRMRLVRDHKIADRLWRFGKFLMGSSTFTFVADQGDKLILAALLDATAFGFYVIAQIWILAGQMLINKLTSRVGFPAMSDVMRNRPKELGRLFRKFQSVIDVFCFSAFVVVLLFGDMLIESLYTPEYHIVGSYLSILSLSLLMLRFRTLDSLLVNMGNSRSALIISAVRAVSICIAIPVSYTLLGIEGALLAVAMNTGLTAPYTLALLRPTLGEKQFLFDYSWLVCSIIIAGVVYTTA